MILAYLYVVLCAIIFGIATSHKLPSNLIRCSRSDKACLHRAVQDAIPKFAKGIRSMNINALDPLIIPKMEIPGGTGAIRLTQTFNDCQLIGLSTMKLESVDFDVDMGRMLWKFHVPKMLFKGNYTQTGQFLVFPVNGKGPMEIQFEDVRGDGDLRLSRYTKNNEEYFRIEESLLKLDAGLIKFDFKNLFDGNEQLSKQINDVMNENWRDIFDELKEKYNEGYAVFTDSIANTFFSNVPINEIFLD